MLRKRSDERTRQERGQQRALLLFAAALIVLIGFCAVAGWQMLVRPARLFAAGAVTDYVDEQPRRFTVPKLRVSEFIPKGDSINSEDVIYVRRDEADGWIALLGVDTLSGCFLYWNAERALFTDNNCLGSRYTPDGRYQGGLITNQQPQPMARLVVEVRDGQVFVRDELARHR
jgi:Rieske Fe-S protein